MSLASMHSEPRADGLPSEQDTIAALFARQAAKTPDAIAVIAGEVELSYRELDRRSNALAGQLWQLGIRPDTLVGVATERTEALIVSLLAILKAGGAYVPLDPGYPLDRLSWMVEDSRMPVLLTTAATRQRIEPIRASASVLDVTDAGAAEAAFDTDGAGTTGRNLAYVIYTSGSTGKPKGVMIENRNVVNFFAGMDQAIGCTPGVWLAVTSMSFDISVLELMWTLTRGFTVVLHGEGDSAAMSEEILRHGVTHLQMTPSLAAMLTLNKRTFAVLGTLRQILLGGEAVPAALVRKLRQVFHGEIYNMYGPTETTIWSTCGRVDEIGTTISIGKPILNTDIVILDAESKPVPPGEAGELLIGGEGVARGYWNRPDLTAERFISIPALCGSRWYRTGDLACFRPDGSLEFLGRVDYQIKLRGHRIEPAEIEAALEECAGIHRAIVVLREDREGDKRLVAYLTGETPSSEMIPALRRTLEAKLPDFMVPSNFVFLPELPLTDNGKVDRKALLKLPPPVANIAEQDANESQPATEVEQIVANAWKDALGVTAVGLHENFFDLGAHSLTVAEVHARLQDVLGREFDLIDLFQYTTVSTLAAHLGGALTNSQTGDRASRRRMAMQR